MRWKLTPEAAAAVAVAVAVPELRMRLVRSPALPSPYQRAMALVLLAAKSEPLGEWVQELVPVLQALVPAMLEPALQLELLLLLASDLGLRSDHATTQVQPRELVVLSVSVLALLPKARQQPWSASSSWQGQLLGLGRQKASAKMAQAQAQGLELTPEAARAMLRARVLAMKP